MEITFSMLAELRLFSFRPLVSEPYDIMLLLQLLLLREIV